MEVSATNDVMDGWILIAVEEDSFSFCTEMRSVCLFIFKIWIEKNHGKRISSFPSRASTHKPNFSLMTLN